MALVDRVKKDSLKREWRSISLLFAELVVLLLIIAQFIQVIGLNINFQLGQVVLKPYLEPVNIIILALALVAFALLYFEVKKRQPSLYEAQKKAPGAIKESARRKLKKAREEPQAPALLLIEFLFVATVVLAITAFMDEDLELIPWSAAGIGPPITTVVNGIIAVIVLLAFYCLYRYTAAYRKQ